MLFGNCGRVLLIIGIFVLVVVGGFYMCRYFKKQETLQAQQTARQRADRVRAERQRALEADRERVRRERARQERSEREERERLEQECKRCDKRYVAKPEADGTTILLCEACRNVILEKFRVGLTGVKSTGVEQAALWLRTTYQDSKETLSFTKCLKSYADALPETGLLCIHGKGAVMQTFFQEMSEQSKPSHWEDYKLANAKTESLEAAKRLQKGKWRRLETTTQMVHGLR